MAGLALAALTLGWPLAATFSGRLFYMRYGFRPTVLIGMGLVLVGVLILVVRAQSPQVAVVAVACFVMGLGLGLVASPSLIAAQASVGWAERGVVTGANMFARSIGSAVGVAIFGAVANAVLDRSGGPTQPQAVIDAAGAVFVAVLVATVLTTVVAFLMPWGGPTTRSSASPNPRPSHTRPPVAVGSRRRPTGSRRHTASVDNRWTGPGARVILGVHHTTEERDMKRTQG